MLLTVTQPLGRGQWGQSATPDSEKCAKKLRKRREKIRKYREKRGRIGKKRQKWEGSFTFAPPDRQGWLRY